MEIINLTIEKLWFGYYFAVLLLAVYYLYQIKKGKKKQADFYFFAVATYLASLLFSFVKHNF